LASDLPPWTIVALGVVDIYLHLIEQGCFFTVEGKDLESLFGVQLKVSLMRWVKELSKNFYGATTAFGATIKLDAAQEELS
jgi:hypothetical protein